MNMFANCSSLTSLDVSSFNTGNVTTMHQMFSSCSGLTTIYASSSFVTTAVTTTTSHDMFSNCINLAGGAGTAFSSSNTDKTYALIDGGPSAPGYFTARP